jgi:hypothetical protein
MKIVMMHWFFCVAVRGGRRGASGGQCIRMNRLLVKWVRVGIFEPRHYSPNSSQQDPHSLGSLGSSISRTLRASPSAQFRACRCGKTRLRNFGTKRFEMLPACQLDPGFRRFDQKGRRVVADLRLQNDLSRALLRQRGVALIFRNIGKPFADISCRYELPGS